MNETDRQLADLLLDGALDEEDAGRLVQRIEEDPEWLAWYAERALLHTDLRRSLRRRASQQLALADAVVETSSLYSKPEAIVARLSESSSGTPDSESQATENADACGLPLNDAAPRQGCEAGWKPALLARRTAGWLLAVAGVALIAVIVAGRWESSAFAEASEVVEAAIHTHVAPVERVYTVDVRRREPLEAGELPLRDVKVATQGDRFWVEAHVGERHWIWGRDHGDAIWMTLGPRQALRIESNETGQPLRYYADIYSLRIESLLNDVLEHFDLERTATEHLTHVITARSRGGRPRWLQNATIEVDVETKAVRRLVLEREYEGKSSVVTFTLVEARIADESKYGLEGHLEAPFHVYSPDLEPEKRREVLVEWFGPYASYWIK